MQDGRTLEEFRQRAVASERLAGDILEESDAGVIEKLRLREQEFLKRAAVLLFHRSPASFVRDAYVKLGYFRDAELLYQDVIEGNLFEQVDRTMDLLYSKYSRALISYKGVYRVETFPVPREAMREAVINAVIHRDYADPVPIQIRVYEDRIMLWNPGHLPADWSVEQLIEEHASRPYNPAVAYAFFRAGMIEAWGRGIRRITTACEAAGNPLPLWRIEPGGGLWLEFRYSAAYRAADATIGAGQAGGQAELAARDGAILQACVQGETASDQLLAAAGYARRTGDFRKRLARLLHEELLEMTVPDRPRSPLQKYRLTDKGRAAVATLSDPKSGR